MKKYFLKCFFKSNRSNLHPFSDKQNGKKLIDQTLSEVQQLKYTIK